MSDPNPLARFDRAAAAADAAIAAVRPEQLDAPTPCTEWTVRQLLNHVVGGNKAFASMQTGGGPVDRTADHLGDDPVAAFRTSVARLRDVFAADGALEKTVVGPFGEVPGAFLVTMRVNEMMVHGWDVAKATGQHYVCNPVVAERAREVSAALLAQVPAGRSPFAPPVTVEDSAPAIDRLVGLLGRQP